LTTDYTMASYPQRKLMTDILNLPGFIVKDYVFIDEVGIVLSLENLLMTVKCPYCGSSTGKLHQNNFLTIRDISWGEQKIYLKVNRARNEMRSMSEKIPRRVRIC
jgi:transposase